LFAELRRIVISGMGQWLLGVGLASLLHGYLGRVAVRLGRLLDAIEAGRLKPLDGADRRWLRKEAGLEAVEAVVVERRPAELQRIPPGAACGWRGGSRGRWGSGPGSGSGWLLPEPSCSGRR
jgi:hypothetical protein